MPNKPIKRGLKFIAVCCADHGIVLNGFPHNKPMANLEKAANRVTVAWLFDLLTSKGIEGGLTFLGQNYEVLSCHCSIDPFVFMLSCSSFQLFTDSYYTSPQLTHAMRENKVFCCGTLKTAGRSPIPEDIMLGEGIDRKLVKRGDVAYCHSSDGKITVCRWMDKRPVVVMYTTPFIGESSHPVGRRIRLPNAKMERIVVNRPDIVEYYNWFMRGLDITSVPISTVSFHCHFTLSLTTLILLQRPTHSPTATPSQEFEMVLFGRIPAGLGGCNSSCFSLRSHFLTTFSFRYPWRTRTPFGV